MTYIEHLRDRAQRGDAESQFWLGWEILNNNAKGSKQEGISWYHLAAHQGHILAMRNLGASYQKGLDGLKKDPEIGFNWHHTAAKNGLIDSKINVGMCYAKGKGIIKDEVLAFMWLYIAIPLKEWWNGELYVDESTYDEIFLKNNYTLQVRRYKDQLARKLNYYKKGQAQLAWFKLGNKNGPLDCLLALAQCYEEDEGMPNHYQEAAKLYKLVAEFSWSCEDRELGLHYEFGKFQIAAWESLGRCYKNGLGVTKNMSLSDRCFAEAERLSEEIPCEYLE